MMLEAAVFRVHMKIHVHRYSTEYWSSWYSVFISVECFRISRNCRYSFSHFGFTFAYIGLTRWIWTQVILQQIFCRFHRFCCGMHIYGTRILFSSFTIFIFVTQYDTWNFLHCRVVVTKRLSMFHYSPSFLQVHSSLCSFFGTEPLLRSLSAEGFTMLPEHESGLSKHSSTPWEPERYFISHLSVQSLG